MNSPDDSNMQQGLEQWFPTESNFAAALARSSPRLPQEHLAMARDTFGHHSLGRGCALRASSG